MMPGDQSQSNWAAGDPSEVRTSTSHDSDAPTEPTAQSWPPPHKVVQVDLQAGLLRAPRSPAPSNARHDHSSLCRATSAHPPRSNTAANRD